MMNEKAKELGCENTNFTNNKIREDKAFFEEMLKKENPTYENCFISKVDVDNSYIIIPKGLTTSDLEIKLDYGGTETSEETVTARYFYKNHLVGQIGFLVDSTEPEDDDVKNMVQVSISEERESEEPLFNWKSFMFVMIAVVFIAGVILKVSLEKERNRYRKNRSGNQLKRKGIRTKRGYDEKEFF